MLVELSFAVAPELPVAGDLTSFPDRIARPAMLACMQAAVALPPLPERTTPLAATVFPDRVVKPFYPVNEQQAFAIGKRNAKVFGTPTVVETSGASSSTTSVITRTVKAGNYLVLYPSWDNSGGGTITGVSDDVNGAWPPASFLETKSNAGGDQAVSMYGYANTLAGNITITVTFSISVAFRKTLLVEVTDVNPNPLDGHKSNEQTTAGTGTDAVTSTNASNANAPVLALGYSYNDSGEFPPAPGTGFASEGVWWLNAGAGTEKARLESLKAETPGSRAATFTAQGGHGTDDYATFLIMLDQEPVTPPTQTFGWDPIYPAATLRAAMPARSQVAFVISMQPERTAPFASEVHADRVLRAVFPAYEQLAVTSLPPFPERAAPLASEVHADRVLRVFFPTHQQLAATELPPQPERTAPLASTWYDDRVLRSSYPTYQQLAVTSETPQPERSSPLAVSVYPDAVRRATFPTVEQLASEVPHFPERTSQIVNIIFPDFVLRAKFPTSEQTFFTTSMQPERSSPLASTWYDDRVLRASFPTHQQLAAADMPVQPERTAALASVWFADRVVRPFYPVAEQLAVTSETPQPERTTPLASTWYDDRVVRATFATHQQKATTELPPFLPTTQILGWDPVYPERVLRSSFVTTNQSAFTASLFPERTTLLASTTHADRVVRPTFLVHQQQATTEVPSQPEQTISLGWEAFFPERVLRWLEPTFAQPYFAFAPQPERTAPLACEWHADRVLRPFYPVSAQLAVTEVQPQPERTVPLADEKHPDFVRRATFPVYQQLATTEVYPQPELVVPLAWDPFYPDRVTRALQPVFEHPFFTFAPQPERAAPLAITVGPDRIVRPFFATAQQLAATELPIQPERTVPLASEWHADRVLRPTYPVYQQLAVTAVSPRPELTVPLAWQPLFPEKVLRPVVPTNEQPYFAFWPLPLPAPPTLPLVWYPHGVVRPYYQVATQQAVTQLSPRPERSAPLAAVAYPDSVLRPKFGTYQQLAVTSLFPKPERTSPVGPEPVYPSRITRPFLLVSEQAYFTFAPQPERPVLFFSETFPDRVDRPTFGVHQQLAVTGLSPLPILLVLGWGAFYPERVLRATLPVDCFPSFVLTPPAAAPAMAGELSLQIDDGAFALGAIDTLLAIGVAEPGPHRVAVADSFATLEVSDPGVLRVAVNDTFLQAQTTEAASLGVGVTDAASIPQVASEKNLFSVDDENAPATPKVTGTGPRKLTEK